MNKTTKQESPLRKLLRLNHFRFKQALSLIPFRFGLFRFRVTLLEKLSFVR